MELYNATSVADPMRRRELLVELMGEVGDDVEVRSPVYVDYGSNVRIGTGVFLNYGCQLADVARITIGDQRPDRPVRPAPHPDRIPSSRDGGATGGRRPDRSSSATTSGWPAASSSPPASRSGATPSSGPGRSSPGTSRQGCWPLGSPAKVVKSAG